MGLGGAGCRAGAGGTLDRANVEPPGFREAFEPRQNIACRAHVAGFFLNPDNLARVGMLGEGGGNFRTRQRVELVEKEDGGIGVLAAAAFGAHLVADFSAGDEDAAAGLALAVRDPGEENPLWEILPFCSAPPPAPPALYRPAPQPTT